MNNKKKRTPANPNPRKTLHAFFFVRSLYRISLRAAPFHRRCTAIRRAAYASMARSTCPRRAWSRALLYRLRRARPAPARLRPPRDQEEGLRLLVPGSRAMDFCKLLEEAIDYVACLRTQVQLMQEIADSMEDGRA